MEVTKKIPFRDKIEEIKQIKGEKNIQIFTDAGVNRTTGESSCGIIIEASEREIEIKGSLSSSHLTLS